MDPASGLGMRVTRSATRSASTSSGSLDGPTISFGWIESLAKLNRGGVAPGRRALSFSVTGSITGACGPGGCTPDEP